MLSFLKDFDFIGKLENFEEDFLYLKDKLNFPLIPNYNIDDPLYKKYSKSFPKYTEYYKNPKTIEKVQEIYIEDIMRFNYKYEDLEK